MDGSMDKVLSQDVENVRTVSKHHNQHTEYNKNSSTKNVDSQDHYKHSLVCNSKCFAMMGLCNGIGFTVLSSATFDIIRRLDGISDNNSSESHDSNHTRDCIETSPAVFLAAEIAPAIVLKLVLPFIPFYVNANIILSCLLSVASFIIVAVAQQKWQAIIGIMFMSISSDLCDITTISYLAKFVDRKNLLLAFSSGGGASGVIASFCYAALCDIGFTPKTIIILSPLVPMLGLVSFVFIKKSGFVSKTSSKDGCMGESDSTTEGEEPPTTLREKWQYLPKLTIYFVPMLVNCLFSYIIGQTFDLIYVPGIWLSHADQYRWIGACSEFGSLFGRLALSYVTVDDIWPLNLLIGEFMMYFVFESIFMAVSKNIWVIFIFVFVSSFLSDYTILSVYNKLTDETPEHYQVFAICSVSIGLSFGVIAAGAITIPMHSAICKLPPPL